MPALKTYDLFISHAWKYNDHYYRLVKLLKDAPLFTCRNYSVPKSDPVIDPKSDAGKKKLIAELKKQIKPVNCVLILSGMYVAYSDWIQIEIDIALGLKKPIVGIRPWGQTMVPSAVQNSAKSVVGWNTSSIVDAIRSYSI